MGAFEDFVNTELPLRVSIAASPGAVRYPRFTGIGKAVEARTSAEFLGDISGLGADGLTEWDEQGGDPSTPSSAKWKLYFKSGGLYHIDDLGSVTGPLGTGGGAVESVFGRTGAVVAAASDYDASEIDNDSGVSGTYVSDALDTLEGAFDSYLAKSGLTEWDEQGGDPSTPSSAKWKLYFKSGGLYHIDDLGSVTGPLLANIVEDTTPQLGGDLDGNSKNVSGLATLTSILVSGSSMIKTDQLHEYTGEAGVDITGTKNGSQVTHTFQNLGTGDCLLHVYGDLQVDDDVRIDGGILDSSGNQILDLIPTGSANYLTIANQAGANGTDGAPEISVAGSDSNINMNLDAKGSGFVHVLAGLQLDDHIYDSNGWEIIKLSATSSAVNEITISNAATGGAPKIEATGDDSNIDLEIAAKGTTGQVVIGLEGDITLGVSGQTVARAVYPVVTEMFDLGTTVNEIRNGYFGGTVQTDVLRIDEGSVSVSTGTGTVKMGSANAADSALWIPINYNGTTYYVPAWSDATP